MAQHHINAVLGFLLLLCCSHELCVSQEGVQWEQQVRQRTVEHFILYGECDNTRKECKPWWEGKYDLLVTQTPSDVFHLFCLPLPIMHSFIPLPTFGLELGLLCFLTPHQGFTWKQTEMSILKRTSLLVLSTPEFVCAFKPAPLVWKWPSCTSKQDT